MNRQKLFKKSNRNFGVEKCNRNEKFTEEDQEHI